MKDISLGDKKSKGVLSTRAYLSECVKEKFGAKESGDHFKNQANYLTVSFAGF